MSRFRHFRKRPLRHFSGSDLVKWLVGLYLLSLLACAILAFGFNGPTDSIVVMSILLWVPLSIFVLTTYPWLKQIVLYIRSKPRKPEGD